MAVILSLCFVIFSDLLVYLRRSTTIRTVNSHDPLLILGLNDIVSSQLRLLRLFHVLKLGHLLDPLLLLHL